MLDRRCLVLAGSAIPLSSAIAQTVGPAIPGRIDPKEEATKIAADIRRIQKRLASFFRIASDRSKASPPPGYNASNGYFVNAMKSDPELDLAQREIVTDSSEGFQLAMVAQATMKGCRDGFAPGLHSASGLTYFPLAKKAFEESLPSILAIAVELVAAYYTGGATQAGKSISDEVQADMQTIAAGVAQRGFVSSGEHANGWISVATRDQATNTIAFIDKVKPNVNADAREFLNILKSLMGSMSRLNTDGHDPWLRGDWQLGYTAICETASKVMLNPPD